jgi:integrase
MAKITKRSVEALSSVARSPTFLWDDSLAGFGVKALPSGPKRYIVKYRALGGGRSAPQRWLTLGTHGQITPDQARSMAQQVLASVARGDDPQNEKQKRKVAPSLNDVWDRFELEQLPTKKPHTRYDYRNLWKGKLGPHFGKVKVEALSRSEVDKFHKSLRNTPYQANRALAVLARLMSLAETWEWRKQRTNPCASVEHFKEKPRNRYLSLSEIGKMNNAIEELVAQKEISPTAAHAIELLLLTGARVNEILSAEWAWIDRERQVLGLPDSKTGAKPVYLSAAALSALDRQKAASIVSVYIFPSRDEGKRFVGLSKSWAKVCERAGLQGVRLHDLRHTAASIAAGQGASLPLIGKLLGHTQAQTTQRYAHVDIDPALKAANEIGAVVAEAFKRK